MADNEIKLVRVSRIVGLSAAAVVLIAACSSGGSGPASGNGSTTTHLSPQQAMLATATQATKMTSAIETVDVQESGSQNTSTTGTIEVRRSPTLEESANLTITAAGKNTQIGMVLTATAIYFKIPSLTKEIGKPWIKIDLSALNKTALASFAQLLHSLQNNDFASQAQLFATVKHVRLIGSATVAGVPTTEYAGSFGVADALKALAPGFRKALAPALQALGNSTVSFHVWIDGDHHPRKLTEVETINGETIHTTVTITAINQPVQISTPPDSQTFTPPGD